MLSFRIYPNQESDAGAADAGVADDDYFPLGTDDAAPVRRPWWKRLAFKITLGGIAAVIASLLAITKNGQELIEIFYHPSRLRFETVSHEDPNVLLFAIENPRRGKYAVNSMSMEAGDEVRQWLRFGTPKVNAQDSASAGSHRISMTIDFIAASQRYSADGGEDEFFARHANEPIRFVARGLTADAKSKRIAECVVPLSSIESFIRNATTPEGEAP
jgi:hypothetical protein